MSIHNNTLHALKSAYLWDAVINQILCEMLDLKASRKHWLPAVIQNAVWSNGTKIDIKKGFTVGMAVKGN